MFGKHIIKGPIFLFIVSLATAFGVNYWSPKGIALIGAWDPSKGAISARSKQESPLLHEQEIKDIQTVKKLYDEKSILFVDARSGEDYEEGHIKGAISLPINRFNEKMPEFIETYPVSQPIITYCSGRECDDSHYLAEKLMHMGYTDVKIFIDGYPGWEEEGYPVEK